MSTPDPEAEAPLVTVQLVLKGVLADRAPGGRAEVPVPAGAPVEAVATALGLPPSPYIFVVNGAALARGGRLQAGDRVEVIPPMAGG